jgi:general secretion pathway protein D
MNPPCCRPLFCFLALLLLAGCVSPGLREGRELIAAGRVEAGLARLEQGLREHPDDRELRAAYFRQREIAVAPFLANADAERVAGRPDEAEALYRRVLGLDPNQPRAKNGIAEIAAARRHSERLREAEALDQRGDAAGGERIIRTVLAENPTHAAARTQLLRLRQRQSAAESAPTALKGPFARPITLEFRDTPLRTVFEVIARTSGINFVFDKDVKADVKVTLFIRNASIDDAIRLVLVTQSLERKLLNENSLLIYPNTAAKAKEHLELVTRSIYLANADVKQAQTLLKTVAKIRDVYTDENLNLIIIKDSADAVRLAEQLIASIDLAEPEVMLDVEVLEMSRNKLYELGLRFPDQVGYGVLDSTGTTTTPPSASSVASGVINLHNRAGLTSYIANPALLLNLRNEDGNANLLANPRIRVKNRDKAKIHIGEKLPVFTTTSTANVGVAASVNYLDVGLKLEVEPNVFLDDDVAIKVALEVSSIVKEVGGPASSLAYQVGTRSATTSLRLKNGETQILAGLINDEERSSAHRVPGLGDIPLIGRLFSTQRDSASKTEIVLLITPRIVRNLNRPEQFSPTLAAGTESAVGAPATRLAPTRPGQIGVAPGRGAQSAAAAAVPGPQRDLSPPTVEAAPVAAVVEADAAASAPPAAAEPPATAETAR